MKTLRVELADLEGIPHGSAPAGTRAEITAAYTGIVALTDGTLIPNAIKAKTVASSGVVDFSVYPSDSPDVREEYHGFGVTVTAKIQSFDGTVVTARRTVVVPDSSPSTVHLGNLAPADPLPPQWVTVDEFVGYLEAAVEAAENTEGQEGPPGPAGPAGPKGDTGDPGATEWAGITDKPVNFPPAAHAANHATGGSDPITPASIGAPDNAQVSGAVTSAGISFTFGPGQALTNGDAIVGAFSKAENALIVSREHASRHATGGLDPITPADIGAAPTEHDHAMGDVTGLVDQLSGVIPVGGGATVPFGPGAGISIAMVAGMAYDSLGALEAVAYAPGAVRVTTGDEPRPPMSVVFWVGGTTQPTNMVSGDVWLEVD